MKVVVTSDSHGDIDTLRMIYHQNKDSDLFIDAGDSEKRKEELGPFNTVKGNCDFYIKNNYRVDALNGLSIYTVHGHMIFFSDKKLASLANDMGCKIAIHGHTHIPKIKFVDGVWIVCPGSVSKPRGGSTRSYAVINFTNFHDIKIEIKEVVVEKNE